jgi:hypothetical protein
MLQQKYINQKTETSTYGTFFKKIKFLFIKILFELIIQDAARLSKESGSRVIVLEHR